MAFSIISKKGVKGVSELRLETWIQASPQACFDLSRSIDAHLASAGPSGETVVAGRASGLLELGETVTWRAKHLGIWQCLTVVMAEIDPPRFFADEMVKGAFSYMRHEHRFSPRNGGTLMQDRFLFASPGGPVGRLFNKFYLEQYLLNFLRVRNLWLKQTLEQTPELAS